MRLKRKFGIKLSNVLRNLGFQLSVALPSFFNRRIFRCDEIGVL